MDRFVAGFVPRVQNRMMAHLTVEGKTLAEARQKVREAIADGWMFLYVTDHRTGERFGLRGKIKDYRA